VFLNNAIVRHGREEIKDSFGPRAGLMRMDWIEIESDVQAFCLTYPIQTSRSQYGVIPKSAS
jgi:hypothetical protein